MRIRDGGAGINIEEAGGSLSLTETGSGLYLNGNGGGSITLNDNASGGIYLQDNSGGGIWLRDQFGGGIWIQDNAGGGIEISDFNGSSITMSAFGMEIVDGGGGFYFPSGDEAWVTDLAVQYLGFQRGGPVVQTTSRTTAINIGAAVAAAVQLVSAAGTTAWTTVRINGSSFTAAANVILGVRSATNKYLLHVTETGTGYFDLTFATTGGTATDSPIINFTIIR